MINALLSLLVVVAMGAEPQHVFKELSSPEDVEGVNQNFINTASDIRLNRSDIEDLKTNGYSTFVSSLVVADATTFSSSIVVWTPLDGMTSTITITGSTILAMASCAYERTGGNYAARIRCRLNLDSDDQLHPIGRTTGTTAGQSTDLGTSCSGNTLFVNLPPGDHNVTYQFNGSGNTDTYEVFADYCRLVLLSF